MVGFMKLQYYFADKFRAGRATEYMQDLLLILSLGIWGL